MKKKNFRYFSKGIGSSVGKYFQVEKKKIKKIFRYIPEEASVSASKMVEEYSQNFQNSDFADTTIISQGEKKILKYILK